MSLVRRLENNENWWLVAGDQGRSVFLPPTTSH
jgi:hypothetical protein